MKSAPLLLLLASFLLTSHIIRPGACRPQSLQAGSLDVDGNGGGRYRSALDEALLRAAGDSAVSYLLGEKVLRFLQRSPRVRSPGGNALLLPRFPLLDVNEEQQQLTATATQLDARALAHLARSLAALESSGERAELGDAAAGDAGINLLSKRNGGDDAPISIDLTFHLLRNMIEMAKIESMKEQAELNRKFLDEVGK